MTKRGRAIPAALAHLAEPTTSRQEAASLVARAAH
jgi:lipoic acid synthetase